MLAFASCSVLVAIAHVVLNDVFVVYYVEKIPCKLSPDLPGRRLIISIKDALHIVHVLLRPVFALVLEQLGDYSLDLLPALPLFLS